MPLFLMLSLVFFVWLNYEVRKASKSDKKKNEVFFQRESEANFTRKVDITNLDYIKIPLNSLPFLGSYEEVNSSFIPNKIEDSVKNELLSCEKAVINLSHQKILNLTGKSNTDIKLEYGAANLEVLMMYDENFSRLSRTLSKWGQLLFEIGEVNAAQKVLSLALSYKADIEEVFTTLAKIYRIKNDNIKMQELISACDCFDELRKDKITKLIQNI